MQVHVGAVSRRVVEEASKLQVPAIVASQRQCNTAGGYLRWTPEELVEKVFCWSKGRTMVVRDHGGPVDPDDVTFVMRLEADRAAGFNALHLDVSKLPVGEQRPILSHLLNRFQDMPVEVGGERDSAATLRKITEYANARHPMVIYAIVPTGGHIWNDKQIGTFVDSVTMAAMNESVHTIGSATKAHNMDWAMFTQYDGALDAVNIAPEFAQVEIDAWLDIMSIADATQLVHLGYEGGEWSHWYLPDEGTWFERGRTGIRYILETEAAKRVLARYDSHEELIRGRIREHISHR